MATRSAGRLRLASESQRTPLVPSGVMGMLIFVVVEVMLFAGLISAFTIIRSSALVWPPPDQPRLPIERDGASTPSALLASGVCLYLAQRSLRDAAASARGGRCSRRCCSAPSSWCSRASSGWR